MARAIRSGGLRPKTVPAGRKPARKRRAASPASAKPARKVRPIAKDGVQRAKASPPRRRTRNTARPAGALGRLHQIALKATDLEASIVFYRDLLGLPFIARFEPPGLAFFDLDGTRLML